MATHSFVLVAAGALMVILALGLHVVCQSDLQNDIDKGCGTNVTNGQNSTCECDSGFQEREDGASCVPVLGQSCYRQIDCMLSNSDCESATSTCACAVGYIEEDHVCVFDLNATDSNYALGSVSWNVDQGYAYDQHVMYFKCIFDVYDGLLYNVIWYVNPELFIDLGYLTSTEAFDNSISSIDMFAEDNNTEIEYLIYCCASVFDSSGQVLLDTNSSSALKPIEVSTNHVSFIRGEDAQFTVRLNLPFGCSSDTDICKLQYILYDPDDSYDCRDSSIAIRSNNVCGAEVIGATKATIDHWSTVNTTTVITITAINNKKYRLRNHFDLRLETNVIGNASPRWNMRYLASIQVTVLESNPWMESYCSSHVDPHMKLADGKWYYWYMGMFPGYYENQNVEEFVLLRHKNLPMEIQTMTKPCNWGYATCSCSVTMRAGSDVFTINHCHGHATGFLTAKDGILQVYKLSSQKYEIYFPTGMTVRVYIMPYFEYTMNIDIYLSPFEYNQIEGLCGNFNGIPGDDFQIRGTSQFLGNTWWPDAFSMSWGLIATNRADESLLSSTKIRNLGRWPDKTKNVCICQTETASRRVNTICSANERETCRQAVGNRGHLVHATSSQMRDTNARLPDMKQLWLNHSFDKRRRKRQNGGAISKENATQLCIDEFSKCPAYTLKDQITILDVNATIEKCSLDVMLDGKLTWVSPHCDAYTENAKTEMERNADFADNNTALVQLIDDISCLGNCNGHGNCTKGICNCDPGYGTSLCLLNLRDPVVIEEVSGGEICDRSTGNTCTEISVVANGFVETAICRVIILVAGRDGGFNYKSTLEAQCVYVNYNEVYALTQESRRRRDADSGAIEIAQRIGVSVSNDGVTFSETKYVIVLDSSCQENTTDSNGDQVVLLKTGFCYIFGVCYSTDAINSDDTCYKCQPSVDPFLWTNECDVSDDPKSELATILGIVGGTIVVFVVAVVIGRLIRYYLQRKALLHQHPYIEPDVGASDASSIVQFYNKQEPFTVSPMEAWAEESDISEK